MILLRIDINLYAPNQISLIYFTELYWINIFSELYGK